MASFASASKTIVIRTSRDTLGLVVAATAMTFAMAYAVHSKHDAQISAQAAAQAPAQQSALVAQDASPQEVWAGHLAELTPAAAPTPAEPMTSASLTVPKAQLALPMVPKTLPKPRPCLEPQPCAVKTLAAASSLVLTHHQIASAADRAQAARANHSLVGMLNPLNHVPDMSAVGRPFTYAGGAVAGWFKRL